MKRKHERFRFGNAGIPLGLEERLVVPSHIKTKGNLLTPYVNEELIPPHLDLILLEDLSGFFNELIEDSFMGLSKVRGLYLAKNHLWTTNEDYWKISEAIKREYGVEVERGLVLPMESINYWIVIHEALHDVFNNLGVEKRDKIMKSATKSYNSFSKLYRMLNLMHLTISCFKWEMDEKERTSLRNRKPENMFYRFKNFYTFGNLKSSDQLQVVDEFIANILINYRVNSQTNRFDKRVLIPSFRRTLRRVGYKVNGLPGVIY